ncbi:MULTISPECIES: hypothetical protein [Caproicibacterium]|uniref:Zinc ribbon domain-containing protein n=1 Tax=Caproicibacterium argilliputei TaxID=3030016 RepID=A0AA97DA24_9FIRM|nr:hypothetical protein [Caproicibacterium argilliputei]WOC33019.1 hypothetical protein PXC00_03840 [Caproicibacterium argilliputei]
MMKVCPKCKAANGENAPKCIRCGYEFTKDETYQAHSDQIYIDNPKSSRVFRIITIIIAAIGFIDGIILGKVLPVRASLSETASTQFNVPVMISVWIVAACVAVEIWAVACHLRNQENQPDLLMRISKKLTENGKL